MATIHFYQANYLERTLKVENNSTKVEKVDKLMEIGELEKDLKQIIKENISEKSVFIDDPPEWSLIEILETGKNISNAIPCDTIDDCDYIFGRIGRKKDINNLQKRNVKNLSAIEIERKQDEDVEVFTYFYLFFERSCSKMSIVYLSSTSAPNIRNISKLITKYHKNKKLVLEVNPIITKDIAKVLKKKQIVNALSYKIAIPTDKILGLDGIGLPEKVYDEFQNIKSTEIVVTITAERNKSLLKDKTVVDDFRDHIFNTHKGFVKDCLAKAKNDEKGQKLLPYHFLENEFIEKVDFKYKSNNGDERIKEIKDTLLQKYLDHRNELLDYMK